MSEVVRYEVHDGVAHVVIDRPEVRNAMSMEVFYGLRERAAEAADDGRVGAVVVRGEGGTFSSGIDVSVFGGQSDAVGSGQDPIGGVDGIGRLQAAFTAYEDLDKPTIAAISGYCFGAGVPITFTNVDWFECPADEDREALVEFIRSKQYCRAGARFLVLGDSPDFVFTIDPEVRA